MTTENIDLYRTAAIRWQVSDAGHDPETPSGARLVEWASKQDTLPSVADIADRAAEWNLPIQTPRQDPATVDQAITEARAEGNYKLASMLQQRVDRIRNTPAANQPTQAELAEIQAAREAGDWQKASALQLAVERRMRGDRPVEAPQLADVQPAGFSPEEKAILDDTETPTLELIAKAREQGFYQVASTLQSRLEKTTQ